MLEKKHIFADEYDDEPTALAYTDFTKPMPILEGEDAERFLRIMAENEEKARERAKQPMSLEEAEKRLSYEKIILQFEKDKINDIEKEIKDLEDYINSLNGKEQK